MPTTKKKKNWCFRNKPDFLCVELCCVLKGDRFLSQVWPRFQDSGKNFNKC